MTNKEKVLLTLIVALVAVLAIGGTIFFVRGGNQSNADEIVTKPPATTTPAPTAATTTTTTTTPTATGDEVTLDLQPGLNLVSFGHIFTNTNSEALFSGLISRAGFYVRAGCTGATYPGECTQESIFGDGVTVTPGRGIWILSERGESYQIPSQAREVSDSTAYTLSLKEGWNTVGNPFNKDIKWEPLLKSSRGTATYAKAATGTPEEPPIIITKKYNPLQQSYSIINSGDTIKRNQGLLIKVGGDVDLIIPGQ